MTSRRLYMDLSQQILALIEGGEFPVGARLPPERELAARLGVSRPILREAIIALEVMGRVQVKTGSGVLVTRPRQSSIDLAGGVGPFELTQARAALESEAASLAAPIITNEELSTLEELLDQMSAADGVDEEAAQAYDREFHLTIARATQNKVLESMVEQLWVIRNSSSECRRVYDLVCGEHSGQRHDEHNGILSALKARDPEGARGAMRLHFSRLLEALLSAAENDAIRQVRQQLSESRARFAISPSHAAASAE